MSAQMVDLKFLVCYTSRMNADKKINIALFVDNFAVIDGVVMVIKQYAKHLGDRANVYVVCPRSKKVQLESYYKVIFCNSIHVPFIGYDIASPFGRKKFYREMQEKEIDLVHIHSPFMLGSMALKVAKLKNIPVIATLHSQYKRDFEMALKLKFLSNMMLRRAMKIFNACDEVWAVNSNMQKLLYEYGYEGKSQVMDNATEIRPLENPAEAKAEVNERLGLANEDRVLLFLGRITSQKNVFFTEKVLKVLKDRGFDFKFVFAGDGYSMSHLKRIVKNDGLDDVVIFTGTISDRSFVAKLYARADLFVFPSYYDADAIVKYEAAAQGTPVLFGDGAVTAGGIEDGVNGYLGPDDVEGFATKIEEIFRDEETYATVCGNLATKLYRTWDRAVDGVYARYVELIEENKQKIEQK